MPSYNGRGVHGQVVDSIGRRIVQGEYAEGDTLDLERLQREHDISLTVVREALKVLAGKGLVDARQRRGTYVLPRGQWNLLDPDILMWEITPQTLPRMIEQLAEVRAIVEPAASALAAERRDDDDVEAISGALEQMREAKDPAEATQADLAFHRAVLVATKNDLLARVERLTRSLFEERDRIVHGQQIDSSTAVALHASLLDAITAGDADEARRATEQIIGRAVSDDTESLTTRPTA